MITFFTCPKPFRGHIKIIQGNAIRSWSLLGSRPELMLFDDDDGLAEMAQELDARHVPIVARNECGASLVSDLFAQAQRLTANGFLCHINADIILMDDFFKTRAKIVDHHQFLIVGQRWNLELREPLDFAAGWQEWLRIDSAGSTRLSDEHCRLYHGNAYEEAAHYVWQRHLGARG